MQHVKQGDPSQSTLKTDDERHVKIENKTLET